MQTLAIIELEEGALTVTTGTAKGRSIQVTLCRRVPLQDLGRESVASVLRSLASDVLQGVAGVHVIVGERRIQHFVSVLPKMAPADVRDFVVREALRLTSMPNAAEVLVAIRLVRRLRGGRLVVGATALPRSVWEPLREAFRVCNVPVLSLHSMEACLAASAESNDDAHPDERSAVVECSAGRARFVLCDGKSAVQVRRFMVGSAENNPEALAAQLAMELPRTIDWLRETGHKTPSVLVLGNRIGIDDAALDMIRGEMNRVVRAAPLSAAGFDAPGLATTTLLRELVTLADGPPSLLATPQLRLPPSRLRPVWLAGLAAAGGVCSWVAVQEFRTALTLRDRVAEARTEGDRLRQQLLAANVEIQSPDESNASARQREFALGMRRPVSRLVAEVSNAATPAVLLDGMQFASNDRVVVTGVVRGATRTAALAALSDFAGHMRGLPYLDPDGQEEVGEVAGQPNQFRFRIGMAWRNS